MVDAKHIDILTEVINIGVGEAAEALSELVEDRVELTVPELKTMAISDCPAYLEDEVDSWGVFTSQLFDGDVKGRALLVLSEACSLDLVSVLAAGEPRTLSLTETAKATLQEVGNIILDSCLSVFGNMLDTRLSLAVPGVTVATSREFFGNVAEEFEDLEMAIVVKSELSLAQHQVRGVIFVLLSFNDFELVVQQAEQRWAP